MTDELRTLPEASEKLRASVRTIHTLRKTGVIKDVRIGGKVFIRQSEIDRVINGGQA